MEIKLEEMDKKDFKNNMILSNLILPASRSDCRLLYYRGELQVACDGKIQLKHGEKVSFDTYFNAFFYQPYAKHCGISEIVFNVTIQGQIKFSTMVAWGKGKVRKLSEQCAEGKGLTLTVASVRLEDLPAGGAVYLEAEAISDTACICAGTIETEPVELKPIKVAAIICTYQREEYVYRSIEKIRREVWERQDSLIQSELDFFVVDNGQTLSLKPEYHVALFRNKNYGGSGGFTRGLIEVYRRRNVYTHVLLMDDDIEFETESIFRTIQFLKIVRAEAGSVMLGGQMLLEDRPLLQYASGSRYVKGRALVCGEHVDLSRMENLIQNSRRSSAQFNAWWYCCFPLLVLDQIGLPFPFFIKTDDIEYGLRMKAKLILLNGVGVWHMPFSNKYSPHLEYYIKRNELITSAIHQNGAGVGNSIYKLFRSFMKSVVRREPLIIEYVLMAYHDFLKGPEFLLHLDEEQFNRKLLEIKKEWTRESAKGMMQTISRLFSMTLALSRTYKRTQEEYMQRQGELTSFSFWCAHLGVPMVE